MRCVVFRSGRRITIREREANGSRPPAKESASSTVVRLLTTKRPGPLTCPRTDILKLRTSVTITATLGVGMYSVNLFESSFRSSEGVRPAAGMSFTRGNEILPSGLTVTVRVKASFFHTEMSKLSSGPIRNSSGSTSWLVAEPRFGGADERATPVSARAPSRTTTTSFEGPDSPYRLAAVTAQKYFPGPGSTRAIWALVRAGETLMTGSVYVPGAGPHFRRYSSTGPPPTLGSQDS